MYTSSIDVIEWPERSFVTGQKFTSWHCTSFPDFPIAVMEKFISSFNYVIEPIWRSLKSPDLSVPSKSSFHCFKSFSRLMKSGEVTSNRTWLCIRWEPCFSIIHPVSTAAPHVVQPAATENSFCSGKTRKCSTLCFMINGFVALSQRPSEWVIAATASPYYKSHCTPSHIVIAHHVGVCFCIT